MKESNLIIETDTYKILFNKLTGHLELDGVFFSENVYENFAPLFSELDNYFSEKKPSFIISFKPKEHIGHACSVMFNKLLTYMKTNNIIDSEVFWYINKSDEELEEIVEDIMDSYSELKSEIKYS